MMVGAVLVSACNAAAAQDLLCFTVYRQDSLRKSHEMELLRAQYAKGAGIFACGGFAVYSDAAEEIGQGLRTVQVYDVDGDFHAKRNPKTEEWLNTGMFFQVWKAIRAAGRYAHYDWVVKVDPQSVFVPSRLMAKLAGITTAPVDAAYLKTCGGNQQPFLGSLEVFSRSAFLAFLSHLESCKESLPWLQGSMREHRFAAQCMDHLGVGSIDAVSLALDEVCAAKQGEKTDADKGAVRRLGMEVGAGSDMSSSPVLV